MYLHGYHNLIAIEYIYEPNMYMRGYQHLASNCIYLRPIKFSTNSSTQTKMYMPRYQIQSRKRILSYKSNYICMVIIILIAIDYIKYISGLSNSPILIFLWISKWKNKFVTNLSRAYIVYADLELWNYLKH